MSEKKISPPEWLTVSYIEKALQKNRNDPNLKVKSCDITPATAIGDHYGSVMLRFHVVLEANGKDEQLAMVAKLPISSRNLGKFDVPEDFAKQSFVFKIEIEMYTKTIPALNRILRRVYPKQENLSAECYHSQIDEEIICIFMEDLRKSGFTLANRFTGLDSDHTALVLRSLAKLHASSLVHIDEDSDATRSYDTCVWNANIKPVMEGLFQKPIRCIAKNMEKWEKSPEKDLYYKKMKDLEETIVDKVINLCTRDDTKLNVICHGDAWINNMMFRYDENNKLDGLRFLDFQISSYNSPALDLNYFIFLSAQTRFTDIDSLLEIYHETFMETLDDLNYKLKKPFALDDLKKEFNNKLLFGLASFLCILPITTVPPSETTDLENMLNKDSSETRMFDRKEFMDMVKVALPFFEKAGVF